MDKGYSKGIIYYIFIGLFANFFLFSIQVLKEDLNTHQNHPILGLLKFLIPLPSFPCSSTKQVLNIKWTKRRNSELSQSPASSCLPSHVIGPLSQFTSTICRWLLTALFKSNLKNTFTLKKKSTSILRSCSHICPN